MIICLNRVIYCCLQSESLTIHDTDQTFVLYSDIMILMFNSLCCYRKVAYRTLCTVAFELWQASERSTQTVLDVLVSFLCPSQVTQRWVGVMLKIMKPKCDKMIMKHEKWTPTLMPPLHFSWWVPQLPKQNGMYQCANKCPWCNTIGWLHYF